VKAIFLYIIKNSQIDNMGTPLYKQMKVKGTSFYAFPSASHDLNLANYSDDYKINFTKFALLNIPQQTTRTSSARDKESILDFIPKSDEGHAPFYTDDPNVDTPVEFSEQLVESLRNYVANYDSTLHESRINSNTDFYNIGERFTPTEQIFWKWCRKLNIIDFEPGVHKVDWDKNLPDFDNVNASTAINVDYFRKYLWKEREIIQYNISSVLESGDYQYNSNNTPKITADDKCKFKVGDPIQLIGDGVVSIPGDLSTGTTYIIGQVQITGTSTWIWIDHIFQGLGGSDTVTDTNIYLDYDRLVQYVGEINQVSNIQTASRTGQEITAYIPHQVGATPTVLFGTRATTNYYPNLEMPVLSEEIQNEILGAESLNSPIRTTPVDYPGSYFGQFDTNDNTYLCTDGDKLRYQGDYYGMMLTNNVGLSDEYYFENLSNFNSNKIDGMYMDFNRDHYYKMHIAGMEVDNFDEFNSISIEEEPPADFDFNAVLWYYEIIEEDNEGNTYSYTNLYGIEFLNNPESDDDSLDDLITPYQKLVTNGSQDGLSYMFNLNIHYNIDNDVLPLTYDPSTIYNMFGFDLYNEMMKKYYRVNENFINIINEFVRINMDLQDMKSLIYTQTSMDELRSKMTNMEALLTLYQTNQFIDSATAKISVDNAGTYPRLKFNVVGVEYDEIQTILATDAYNYNFANIGASYSSAMSFTNKMLLNIINDNISTDSGVVSIVLDSDLRYKQKLDIIVKPDFALYGQRLYLNMNFNYNNTITETNIFNVDLPTDVSSYNVAVPEDSTFVNSYYTNENIYTNTTDIVTGVTWCETGFTQVIITEDLFRSGDTVYVQNLYLRDVSGVTDDYSGAYDILEKNGIELLVDLKAYGFECVGSPIVSYYKGIQISILRVDESNSSLFEDRYDITYKII
jgi:hypothetical protein